MASSPPDVARVLDELGIEVKGTSGDEARCLCPFHEDSDPSFGVNLRTGAWLCRVPSCGQKGKSIDSLWAMVRGVPSREAHDELTSKVGTIERPHPVPSKAVVDVWQDDLYTSELAAEYLRSHGIELLFALESGWGFCKETKAIKIPIWDREKAALLNVKSCPIPRSEGRKKSSLKGRGSQYYPLWLWDPRRELVICEGESDAIALHGIGVNALTRTAGVGSITCRDFLPYVGEHGSLVLCLDMDEAGRKKSIELVESFNSIGITTRVVQLPRNDIAEALSSHAPDARRAAWVKLLENSVVHLEVTKSPDEIESDETLTGMGNSSRLARMFGESLRWSEAEGLWMIWDGTRWVHDHLGHVPRLARAVVHRLRAEADAEDDADMREERRKWARTSASLNKITEMTVLCQSEPGIAVRTEDLDRDLMSLNVANGTIDLRTGELRKHDPKEMWTRITPIAFDPAAKCPMWEQTLSECLAYPNGDSDNETVEYFQRMVGYCLTGRVEEDALFLWYGRGANGKSMVIEILQALLAGFTAAVDFHTFCERGTGTAEYTKARFNGARIVTCIETNADKKLDEALVKSITGRDRIPARNPYGRPFDFEPTHKLVIAANHKPKIQGNDHGIWRRIHLVPFEIQFGEAFGRPKDGMRGAKLLRELPGILAWAVRGSMEWCRRFEAEGKGLDPTSRCRLAVQEYQEQMDTTAGFFDKCVVAAPNRRTARPEVYKAYTMHCQEQMIEPLKNREFGRLLDEYGFRVRRSNGVGWVHGMLLADETREKIANEYP